MNFLKQVDIHYHCYPKLWDAMNDKVWFFEPFSINRMMKMFSFSGNYFPEFVSLPYWFPDARG